jgi:Arc/MetJ-type ribon-helix-helix transcriptional regulator
MAIKQRLSTSVDEDLINAGQAAVQAGRAESLSAWVNEALRRQAEHERRLRALDAVVLLATDGDEILTSDPDDLAALAEASGAHTDLITV